MRVAIVDHLVTRELRRAVLRPSWPVGSVMSGDDEPGALHLAALDDDGAVLGSGVVLPAPDPRRPDAVGAWQLRGMATAAGLRGQGIGAQVLAAAIDEVTRRGATVLWCNARTVALSFYRRAGFEVDGAEFVQAETGIPHHRMHRTLP